MIRRHPWGVVAAALAAILALAWTLELAPGRNAKQRSAAHRDPTGEARGSRTQEPQDDARPETPPSGEYELVELVADDEGNLIQGRLYADGTFVPAATQCPRRIQDALHRLGRFAHRREVRRTYRGLPVDAESNAAAPPNVPPGEPVDTLAARLLSGDTAGNAEDLLRRLERELAAAQPPSILTAVAARVVEAARCGVISEPGRRAIGVCAEALARTGDDYYVDLLLPVFHGSDVDLVTLVVRHAGMASLPRFLPRLLLDALVDDRRAVVEAALSHSTSHRDPNRAAALREALTRVFHGGDDELRLRSCFPLMHEFGDVAASAYLVSLIASGDPERRRRALTWLGDECNLGRQPPEGLLDQLSPLLESARQEDRELVVQAAEQYVGPDVMRWMIPLLADALPRVAETARNNLLHHQRDRAMVRTLLREARRAASGREADGIEAVLAALDSSD